MFATVLKNSILSVLIILIIHFLIKKQLLNASKPLHSFRRTDAGTEENRILAYISSLDSDGKGPIDEKLLQIASTDEDVLRKSQSHQLKELYDFVFNDESSAKELGSFYKQLPSTDPSKPVRCNPSDLRTDNNTMCDDAIGMHIQSQKKQAISENNLKYYKNAVGINEYPDENIMNGGLIDGLLTGYDNFDVNFERI
jgi:hypothetical protein